MKRIIFLILLLVVLLLGGCGKEQTEIKTLADMKDMTLTIALPDDLDSKSQVLEVCPNAQIIPQNDVLFGVRSVSEGKADAFIAGRVYIENVCREVGIKNVRILEDPLISYPCALGLSKLCAIPEFENAVNATMERLLADGTIDQMKERWLVSGDEQMPEIKLDENPKYMINGVTFGECKPYSYFKNGQLAGFDVELIYRVCADNHWGLNLTNTKYEGMLMGLSVGKYDIVSANLYITENREENVVYSIPHRNEEINIVVHDASATSDGTEDQPQLEYNTCAELRNAKKFAVTTGTIGDLIVKEHFPQAEIEYYPTPTDGALALTSGKVDAVVFDAPALSHIAGYTKGAALMPEYITKDDYYFILPKSERGEALRKEFNEWLSAQKQSGELKRMYDFWCGDEEPEEIPDFGALPDINGTIRIATDATGRPDAYFFHNSLVGYPIELIYNFCRDRGYGTEVSLVSFDGMIPTLVSEKADFMVALVSYTEERAQSVLYTDCILEGGVGALVRAIDAEASDSFLNTIKNGLRKTFVTEGRWKLIVSGFGVTFLITLGGFALANILGAAFCACTMSKSKFLRFLADVFDRIMQGTPMVVVLMILYYVILGKSDISGVWVAIIAFGMNSGASLARQFYGAITGVDIGQNEAALAIGFTKFQAFTGIVFPQAARTALSGYFSEIIALMKGTAIVGYIAVTDLTKAGDLIRSSTYDAFFPLLSVAIIYFLITFGILSLLKTIQKKLAPKRVVKQEAEK